MGSAGERGERAPRPKSCREETFARQKWRAFLWQRLRPRLPPFVCLSGALSWPLQDHIAAAWRLSRVEYRIISYIEEKGRNPDTSESRCRHGITSNAISSLRLSDERECPRHLADTRARAQLCASVDVVKRGDGRGADTKEGALRAGGSSN